MEFPEQLRPGDKGVEKEKKRDIISNLVPLIPQKPPSLLGISGRRVKHTHTHTHTSSASESSEPLPSSTNVFDSDSMFIHCYRLFSNTLVIDEIRFQ